MTAQAPDSQELAALLARLDKLRCAERRASSARMVSVIGHLIGTPLNVIAGRAALIRTNPAPDAVEENVRRIEEQVERLSQRIRRLIDYFGWVDPPAATQPLGELMTECATLYGPIAKHQGVTLELNNGELDALQVDGSLIPLVLTTLLSLALRTSTSGARVKLQVVEQGPKRLVFELTAPGLTPPPGRLDRLEPPESGVRYEASTLETLWLCLGLARRIGGNFELAPAADGGMTLRLECVHA